MNNLKFLSSSSSLYEVHRSKQLLRFNMAAVTVVNMIT